MSRRISLLVFSLLALTVAVADASKPAQRPGLKVIDPCVQQCVQSGEDSICCRYLCHPIGHNPC